MAQRVQTLFVSDLSGDELGSDGQTVNFSIQGVDYEIDLSKKELAGLEKSVAIYVEHARKVGGRQRSGGGRQRPTTGRDPGQTKAIKAWADSKGVDYPKRGRLPQSVIDQYEAAQKG